MTVPRPSRSRSTARQTGRSTRRSATDPASPLPRSWGPPRLSLGPAGECLVCRGDQPSEAVIHRAGHPESAAELEADKTVQRAADEAGRVDGAVSGDAIAGEHVVEDRQDLG